MLGLRFRTLPCWRVLSFVAMSGSAAAFSHLERPLRIYLCKTCPFIACTAKYILYIYIYIYLHASKSHGKKDPTRLYVRTNVRPVCLKGFTTRERILEHVRRGRTPCKRQLLLMGPIMTENQADELDESLEVFYRNLHHKGQRRHRADAPCVLASGPPTPRLVGPVA